MAAERKIYRGTFGKILLPTTSEAGHFTPRQSRQQTIKGINGCLRWHYFVAADVRSYTVTRDVQGNWSMVCQLANADAYKMAQTPLRFVAFVEAGEWVWVVDEITVRGGGVCTATLFDPLT